MLIIRQNPALRKSRAVVFLRGLPFSKIAPCLTLVAAAPAGMVGVGASAVVIAAASAGEQEDQDDDPPEVVAAAKTVVTAHNKPSAYFI